MQRILIRGEGIAMRCCHHLLSHAGCEVAVETQPRPRLPAIMLGGSAVTMLRDVFAQPHLFGNAHRIQKRIVAWGQGSAPIALDHSAIVVSEQQLLDAIPSPNPAPVDAPDWTVITTRPLPGSIAEHHFGSRHAQAQQVALTGPPDTCYVESLESGWLFLIPNSNAAAWLLSIGDAEISQSRLIAPQIAEPQAAAARFPSYPRIVQPLCGSGWIACGSAAMAFDPICGDGTANAVREAILASAVIRQGPDALAHYEARLTAGFQRHLSLCLSFYETGGAGAWWKEETAALQRGLLWCAERSRTFPPYRYQLNGFDLVPVLP